MILESISGTDMKYQTDHSEDLFNSAPEMLNTVSGIEWYYFTVVCYSIIELTVSIRCCSIKKVKIFV